MENWSCEDVAAWLRSIDLRIYSQKFIDNKIDGEILQLADEDMLEALEIESQSHRYKILQEIEAELAMEEKMMSPKNDFDYKRHGAYSPHSPKDDSMLVRLYGNQIPGKEQEPHRTIKISPLDIGITIVEQAMQKFKVSGQRYDYFLILIIEKKKYAIGPEDNVYSLVRHGDLDEMKLLLRSIRSVTGPSTPALNLEPGTFMAANLGTTVLASAIGVHQYEAQTREEIDVTIGSPYDVLARDGEWCIVEVDGHRGSVPSRCLAVRKDPLITEAKCIHSFLRKSKNELSLDEGVEFSVLGVYDQWCQIKSGEVTGFVPVSYTSIGKLYDPNRRRGSRNHFQGKVQTQKLSPSVLTKLDTLQQSLPNSPDSFKGLSPPLKGDARNQPAIFTRIEHMNTFLAFWKTKANELNPSDALKQILDNTRILEEALFSQRSAVLEIILNDSKLSSLTFTWLDEFCKANAAKISNFSNARGGSRDDVYLSIKNAIRKNFSHMMKFMSQLLDYPKIKSILESNPILAKMIAAREIEARILNLL